MCYNMRRFEKSAEEKKRRQKEQELSFNVEEQPEIIVDVDSESKKLTKPTKRGT